MHESVAVKHHAASFDRKCHACKFVSAQLVFVFPDGEAVGSH